MKTVTIAGNGVLEKGAGNNPGRQKIIMTRPWPEYTWQAQQSLYGRNPVTTRCKDCIGTTVPWREGNGVDEET